MKYPRRATEGEVPFPLAPMIDLTFLLLIFFMVTSRISKESVQTTIRLPVASAGRIPQDVSHRDVIDIAEEGKISIAQTPLDRVGLENHLRSRLQKFPNRKIYLRADATIPARQIKEIITIATEAGASQIILGTHRQ